MEMRHVMQEEPAHPPQKVTVDSGSRPAGETPCAVAVAWERRVGVVEVGDHDEPVRDEEPGDAVVFQNGGGTVDSTGLGDGVDHRGDSDIGCDDDVALGAREED